MLYNNLSSHLRKKYGKRLKKICIDGGFSCPNRDGRCGTGGCIFCGERGAGEHIVSDGGIRAQVLHALKGADADMRFIAYFQNYTNTYAPIEILKQRYDEAIIDDRILVLAIGTRPDCIDDDVAALIASYKDRCDIWVELGLQTANDEVGRLINRGYDRAVFERAVKLLHGYGIEVVAHMIIGLPSESAEDAVKTAQYLSGLGVEGIKIHSIYVMEGTSLADMYLEKLYTPPTLSEYANAAACAIAHISPDIVLHRITGDCPSGLLIAPEWNRDKNAVIEAVNRALSERDLRQGSLVMR